MEQTPVLAGQGPVLAAVSAGGVLGALARWGVGLAWPTRLGAVPWATLTINVVGCLLIGLLIAAVARRHRHHLLRPFLGTGVLGGFTTFSGYAVDAVRLVQHGSAGSVAVYVGGTLLGALAATWIGLGGPRLPTSHR
ncbi:fluoride efflux transporter CrcB [Pseudonocardia xinjiangensis]|uniref:fluoride efflux transporter CrcB n=1 Tax=Pseudonocardia xinjiangensis TaxID=75289 RepID=UPI0028AFD645|nr:fluoride efflux transporter CrcB [Pseudonocardia xinjiangensis]